MKLPLEVIAQLVRLPAGEVKTVIQQLDIRNKNGIDAFGSIFATRQ